MPTLKLFPGSYIERDDQRHDENFFAHIYWHLPLAFDDKRHFLQRFSG
jgi:hypothetical protein